MAEIKFDTGLKTFDINGRCEATFAPTDMAFIEKVYNCLEEMDALQNKYKEIADTSSNTEIFRIAREMDAEARGDINTIFGFDICSPLFGGMSLFTLADGLPVWVNFLLAIIDNLEGDFAEQKKRTNPRVAKYAAKYKKK